MRASDLYLGVRALTTTVDRAATISAGPMIAHLRRHSARPSARTSSSPSSTGNAFAGGNAGGVGAAFVLDAFVLKNMTYSDSTPTRSETLRSHPIMVSSALTRAHRRGREGV